MKNGEKIKDKGDYCLKRDFKKPFFLNQWPLGKKLRFRGGGWQGWKKNLWKLPKKREKGIENTFFKFSRPPPLQQTYSLGKKFISKEGWGEMIDMHNIYPCKYVNVPYTIVIYQIGQAILSLASISWPKSCLSKASFNKFSSACIWIQRGIYHLWHVEVGFNPLLGLGELLSHAHNVQGV